MSAFNAFRQRYLVRFWSPLPALVALGVASAYYFALTGTFWAVTGEFTRGAATCCPGSATSHRTGATSG